MSKEEMLQHLLAQNVDDELSNKIMERLYGYEREELNCLSRTEHLANFTKCGMRIIGIDELPTFNRFFRYFTGYNDKSSELTPGIIERVRNAGYSISDLGIVQITIVLEKYKNLP
jgi:hypothetical protein